ncbi:contact-dependent growth inhibition system immunity protein [Photorhabdus temperata subsp. temperata]
MMFIENQDYRARAYMTDKFLGIDTYSGLGRSGRDPIFPSHLLLPDADDKSIGEKVLQALSDSRTLTIGECAIFFDLERNKEQYSEWIAMLMEQYGYKTKRKLFKNMKSCSIHGVNNLITIRPSYHEKLEAWSGSRIKESDYVVLPIDSSSEEIGAALRLALSRCIG